MQDAFPTWKGKISTSLGREKRGRGKKEVFGVLYSYAECGSQQTVENSERDGHTRPPDLPLEKPVCRSGSNSYNDMRQQTGSK